MSEHPTHNLFEGLENTKNIKDILSGRHWVNNGIFATSCRPKSLSNKTKVQFLYSSFIAFSPNYIYSIL